MDTPKVASEHIPSMLHRNLLLSLVLLLLAMLLLVAVVGVVAVAVAVAVVALLRSVSIRTVFSSISFPPNSHFATIHIVP